MDKTNSLTVLVRFPKASRMKSVELTMRRGVIPFPDMAYQRLGEGFVPDIGGNV